MRNKRTMLLSIGAALVAVGVLLVPIGSTAGSVHRNGSGAHATTVRPMAPSRLPQPSLMGVSPVTTPATPPSPLAPTFQSTPAPSTPLLKIPQNNGGDHDPDNNGGVSDGDGEA
jgi:hypothetical protein